MYNLNQLKTFIKVAEMGSFNKVAEEEYMSPSAVMKQIDNLEADLGGIRLLSRSKRGNSLTNVGMMFYREAKNVVAYCEESKKRIMKEIKIEESTVRVSVTRKMLLEQADWMWNVLHERYSDINLRYVPYSYDVGEAVKLWENYDEWTDIALGIVPDNIEKGEFDGIALQNIPIMCIMSSTHELASKDIITPEELAGQVVYTLKDEWWGDGMKPLNQYLRKNLKGIELIEKDVYDYDVYNASANGNSIIINLADNRDRHPFTKEIPLDWDSHFSFGIIYRKEHGKNVDDFLIAVNTILNEVGK